MKIALLADIHSNNVALEAVLEDIACKDIDRIMFLGDYIFGGYGSNETVDLLMKFKKLNQHNQIIYGNIEELIPAVEKNADWIYEINKHIYNELGKERILFLKSLKDSCSVDVEGISIYLCHNPSDIEVFKVVDDLNREHNIPNLNGLKKIAKELESDICIFGHYHLFMDEEVNGKRFICPSSVGMPFNGDPRAQYMVLNIENGKVMTSSQYVEYDQLRLACDFEREGYLAKDRIWSMNILTTILTAHNYIGT